MGASFQKYTPERMMKKVEAIIRHYKLEEVKNALNAAGTNGPIQMKLS